MTAVLLLGDFPSTGVLGAAPAQRVTLPAEARGAPTFLDLVAAELDTRAAVLVLYPSWRPAEAGRLVALARAARLTDRVAALPLALPPLALSLVADQLAFAAPYVQAGVLASLAVRLVGSVYAGAWVNSVTHLEHVPTGLGAHVSSFLPRSGFSVCAAPEGGVHRITDARPVQAIAARPPAPVRLIVAPSGGDVEWVRRELFPAVGASSAVEVPAQPLGTEFWGTKRYAEFVAFSAHAQALHSTLRAMAYRRCTWCGEAADLPACPFCAMPLPPAPPSPPAAAPQGGGPFQAAAPAPPRTVPDAPAAPPPPAVTRPETPRPVVPLAAPAAPPPAPPDPDDDEWPGRTDTVSFGSPKDR
ncbi:hypothetical protein [Actinomadura parmotrematis]|uniref:Uncharacterized protein n=1 Tax=Actinomadura parmotrematis TaxID=2864039 RepID=A0ABS7FWZ2_9ACTN|nr:hypothetical protein [Actinomadura parmotrematis]MBW8484948.1 hypothetical protein [Actinomadura parmotrematis]